MATGDDGQASPDSVAFPIVRIRDLSASYGATQALSGVRLEASEGALALVGPNGSGKSTLLKVLATLQRPTAGSVHVGPHDLRTRRGAERARSAIGYLAQEPNDLSHLTVEEACFYAAWLKRVPRRQRADAVDATLDRFELVDIRRQKLRTLSGGTRRRAYLAQTLVHRPSLVLLDEPTAGLDPDHRAAVRRSLKLIQPHSLIVFSTHLAEDIWLSYCGRSVRPSSPFSFRRSVKACS